MCLRNYQIIGRLLIRVFNNDIILLERRDEIMP